MYLVRRSQIAPNLINFLDNFSSNAMMRRSVPNVNVLSWDFVPSAQVSTKWEVGRPGVHFTRKTIKMLICSWWRSLTSFGQQQGFYFWLMNQMLLQLRTMITMKRWQTDVYHDPFQVYWQWSLPHNIAHQPLVMLISSLSCTVRLPTWPTSQVGLGGEPDYILDS